MTEDDRRKALRPADVTAWMRDDWDARAQEDARYYINTDQHGGFDFALSGARDMAAILGPLRGQLRHDMRVLEIGCGIGRIVQFLAVLFAEVHGIDIAPAMVEQARGYLARWDNVQVHLGNGRDLEGLPDEHFDFVISNHVFQHIPDKAVIRDYVLDTFRVLRTGGLFEFLVKTGPWADQGERPDTWCGVELGRPDLDAWLGERPWRLHGIHGAPDPALTWVVLQKS